MSTSMHNTLHYMYNQRRQLTLYKPHTPSRYVALWPVSWLFHPSLWFNPYSRLYRWMALQSKQHPSLIRWNNNNSFGRMMTFLPRMHTLKQTLHSFGSKLRSGASEIRRSRPELRTRTQCGSGFDGSAPQISAKFSPPETSRKQADSLQRNSFLASGCAGGFPDSATP